MGETKVLEGYNLQGEAFKNALKNVNRADKFVPLKKKRNKKSK